MPQFVVFVALGRPTFHAVLNSAAVSGLFGPVRLGYAGLTL